MLFRCEENLYNTMVSYAHSHGFKSVGQLIRGILIMNFMNIMLDENKAMTRKQVQKEIMKKFNEYYKMEKIKKNCKKRL